MNSFLQRCRYSLFLCCALLCAQTSITPVTISDIAGDGVVHAISIWPQYPNQDPTARTITFIGNPNNSGTSCSSTSSVAGCIRFGDANISTSRGAYILPGQSGYLPESPNQSRYHLNAWYYLI